MQRKILFLDGLRGVAAFYVMVGHARWLLWEGFASGFSAHPQNYSVIDKALMYFFYLFRWGHEAVLFFFVLSGFVIHFQYAKKLKQNPHVTLNLLQYFYKRIKRIYPPFLLALVLTAFLDFIGKAYNFSIYSGTTPYSLINESVSNGSYGLQTIVGNILFLYKEYVPVFGTNGPTWSLKYEWWFYIMYPVFLLLSRKNIYYSTLLIVALFIGSFYPSIWPEQLLRDIFSYMICWWLGALLAEIVANRLNVKLMHFSGLMFIGFLLMFFLKGAAVLYDFQVALLFSTILGCLLWSNEKNISLKFLERLKPVGDFSYTLYIMHFPILVFLSGVIMKLHGNRLPIHSFFIFGGITICMVVAWLLHFLVEIPFTRSSNVKKAAENIKVDRGSPHNFFHFNLRKKLR